MASLVHYSFRLVLLVLSIVINTGLAQYASAPPVVFPLFVRSPYFSTWMNTKPFGNSTVTGPGGVWPTFWTGVVTNSTAMVRVDGNAFLWHGNDTGYGAATTVASYLTPTQSIFTFAAGAIQFNVTYFSPVEPSNWVRQSLPFAYMSIDGIRSTDGQSHSIQFYCDTSREFLSTNDGLALEMFMTQTSASIYLQMSLVDTPSLHEVDGMAEDGTLYMAMSATTPGMSWQIDEYSETHIQFNAVGYLSNGQKVSTDPEVMAFAINLGNITSSDTPLVWAIGYVRDPVISSPKNGSIESRYSYFWSEFSNIGDAIDSVISGFSQALSTGSALDASIMNQAVGISQQYADLVALSLRQTFGAIDITISKNDNNSNIYDVSDIKIFMKDIGNGRRVNAVETLYAAFPTFLYLNNTMARAMLAPLLEFQASSQYSNPYAAPDLGTTYPVVTGNSTNETALAVENCGTMLVLVLSQAQASGDGSLIEQYLDLLKSWADYLVENALYSPGSITVDGLNGTNNSNLAIKGILGIEAMSIMNKALESYGASTTDTEYYATQAQRLSQQWKTLAFSDHVVSTYGNQSSWGLVYNLFASRLINSQLIGTSLFETQTSFYGQEVTSAPQYGLFLDTSQSYTRSDWMAFAAATTTNTSTRDAMLSKIHLQSFQNGSGNVWPTEYCTTNGTYIKGKASAAQGAMFSFFTLPNMPITLVRKGGTVNLNRPRGAIVGGVLGGGFGICGIFAVIFLYWRRRKALQTEKAEMPLPFMTPFYPDRCLPDNHSSGFGPPNLSSNSVALLREGPDARPTLRAGFSKLSTRQRFSPIQTGGAPTTIHQAQSSRTILNGGSGRDSSSALQNEVDTLRREVEAIRAAQLVPAEEPPPMYGTR